MLYDSKKYSNISVCITHKEKLNSTYLQDYTNFRFKGCKYHLLQVPNRPPIVALHLNPVSHLLQFIIKR